MNEVDEEKNVGVSDARKFVDNAGDTPNNEETGNKETYGEALT